MRGDSVLDVCNDGVDDAREDDAGDDDGVGVGGAPTVDRRTPAFVRRPRDGDDVGALRVVPVRELAVCADTMAAANENIDPATGDRLTSAPGAVRGVLDGSAS